MEQRLPLPPTALQRSAGAMFLDLDPMACNGSPPTDLAFVVGTAPAHEIPAVPLKPAARILLADPALLPPHRKRLAGIDAVPNPSLILGAVDQSPFAMAQL